MKPGEIWKLQRITDVTSYFRVILLIKKRYYADHAWQVLILDEGRDFSSLGPGSIYDEMIMNNIHSLYVWRKLF
jgi:hypothetical protein